MARIVVLPGLFRSPASTDEPDLLPLLNRIAGMERARVRRLDLGATEAMSAGPTWLGMMPAEGELAPGPLRVAALGFDPPERSTHFCLDYLTLHGSVVGAREEEVQEARRLIAPVASGPLRLLDGERGRDALVWDDFGMFRTLSPEEASGKPLVEALPDGEPWLRRFVDDSANELRDADLNKRRVDEGLPPISLAWPWGAGWRLPVPSLPLRLGSPLSFSGEDEALRGLARLAGLKPGAADEIVQLPPLADDFERREWEVTRELPARIAPLIADESVPVALVLPDALKPTGGLWLSFLPNRGGEHEIRREIAEERRVPAIGLPGAILGFFKTASSS